MYCLLGTLVYLDAKLPSPGCCGEGLKLSHSLHSLKEGGREEGEWGNLRGMGGGEEV